MSDHQPILEDATAEEIQAARLLAEALESRAWVQADPEALAVSRLLEAVGSATLDNEVYRRRLRIELVARARRTPRPVWLPFAAAAVLVGAAALGVLISRHTQTPSGDLLAQRELAARNAVAQISASSANSEGAGERAASLLDGQWRRRIDATFRNDRFATLLGGVTDSAARRTTLVFTRSTPTVPTPGGLS